MTEDEQDKYKYGSFIERFKLLAKITKSCPVRYDLLEYLHEDLRCDVLEELASDTLAYKLFVTIIIDRHGTKYYRLRARVVNKDFETSRLTRLYSEESFVRVNFVRTVKDLDTACQLAFGQDFTDNHYIDWEVKSFVHNFSLLTHIMRDIKDTTNHHSEKITNIEDELTEENVNRLNKCDTIGLAAWSATDYDPVEEQGVQEQMFLSLVKDDHSSADDSINLHSLNIAGRCFQYLMTTSSGVHKNVHIYSVQTYKNVTKMMFSNVFIDKHMGYELKLALRMGLWFTPSVTINLHKTKVKKKKDIENIEKNPVGIHTDGCGRVSIALAKEMSAKWNEGKKYKNVSFTAQNIGPTAWNSGTFQDSEIEYDGTKTQPEYYSAFQIRLDGIKGMLVVDPTLGLKKNRIKLSPSQIKFVSPEIHSTRDYKTIEVVQCSQPMLGARLNIALISLIVACAEDSEGLQDYIIQLGTDEMQKLLNETDRNYAIEFALRHNDVKSFNMLGTGCSMLETFLAGYYQNYMRRFKILVENSRRLFGVADFWKVLKKGEVFVPVSNLMNGNSSGPSDLEQKILVTKEPCFHRGDLRTFTTVTKRELELREKGKYLTELQDVIVFSCCQGERPEPDKICGSDLDGDQYFVCWDQNIVEKLRDPLFDAGTFSSVKKEDLEKWYKQKIRELAEKQRKEWTLDQENVPMQGTFPFSSLSPEQEELIKHHYSNSDMIELDLEKEIFSLGITGHPDNQVEENVGEASESSTSNGSNVDEKAARMATTIADNCAFLSVNDLFHIHMRIIDNLKTEWVADENWEKMEKLCQIISYALDSAKTGIMSSKKDVLRDLDLVSLPKYPHFDPSKRKCKCQHSESPLGRIHDKLRSKIDELRLPTATTFDTLYDNISELKLKFLLHYSKNQNYADANNNLFYTSLDSAIPKVDLEDIEKWYRGEIEPWASSDLLKREATCTILWKLITLLNLKAKTSLQLRVICLKEQETLNDVQVQHILNDNGSLPYFCITQRLYEGLKQISSKLLPFLDFSSTNVSILEQHQVNAVIESLKKLIEKTFWKDLELPYPYHMRRTRLIKKQSSCGLLEFAEIRDLFLTQNQKCIQNPIVLGSSINLSGMFDEDDENFGNNVYLLHLDITETYNFKNPPTTILSNLGNILGCLLRFPEAWSLSSSRTLCDQIDKTLFHHLKMYKYANVLLKVHWNQQASAILKHLPRCSWDENRIDLKRLQLAHEDMQQLFKLLFS